MPVTSTLPVIVALLGSTRCSVIPLNQISDGVAAMASSPARPLAACTSMVALTVLVPGSMRDNVPLASLRTHTPLFVTTIGSGVGPIGHGSRQGSEMVAAPWFVRGSILTTVPARLLAIQTASGPMATPEGP